MRLAQPWFLAVIVAVLIILDQATKAWAFGVLSDGSITIIPNYFDFSLAFNLGVSFSLFGDGDLPFQRWLLSAVGIIASIVFSVWMLKSPSILFRFGMALVVAGALGNVIDRIRFGAVIDFISVHYQQFYYWPTFNVADIAISCGIALLLFEVVYVKLSRNKE